MTKTAITAMAAIGPGAHPAGAAERGDGRHLPAGWFDPKPYLGDRGYRHVPVSARLLLSSAAALRGAGCSAIDHAGDRGGSIVGTNFGNYDVLGSLLETIHRRGSDGLHPMAVPSFAVNVPVSHLAIRHGLRAFSVTLTQAVTAGIDALRGGARLLADGRADLVLAGSVEPTLPRTSDVQPENPAAQMGVALFALEPADRVPYGAPLARVLGGFSVLTVPRGSAGLGALAARVERALSSAAHDEPVELAVTSAPGDDARAAADAVVQALTRRAPRRLLAPANGSGADAVSTIPAVTALQRLLATAGVKGSVCANGHGLVSCLFVRVERPVPLAPVPAKPLLLVPARGEVS